jgi:threonine dehydrogenase-like Zn-dependent dehydrogenase
VVKVTACGICGSDLHIYDGHGFSTDIGFCVGHESMDHGGALPDVVLEAVGLDQTITAGIKLVRPSEN